MEFIWFILIGLVAELLAGQLIKGGGFGVIGDIVVSVVGALLGGLSVSLIWCFLGWGSTRRNYRCNHRRDCDHFRLTLHQASIRI